MSVVSQQHLFSSSAMMSGGGAVDYGGSVSFDGNDYLSIADSADFNLGSGDFTIEAYVYANSFSSFDGIIGQWPQNGGNTANSFVFENSSIKK